MMCLFSKFKRKKYMPQGMRGVEKASMSAGR